MLLHRPAQLQEPQGDALYAALLGVREQGLAGRIGASVYDGEELERLCQRFALDLVQAPTTLLITVLMSPVGCSACLSRVPRCMCVRFSCRGCC
ncbi:hypothetical protein ULG90_10850 [Halopseudomonas pachastrellae]|nr:hypothetical protein ULG90_10850 [Halopseudomonas pachastrellae]